jgi:hypothetical protein
MNIEDREESKSTAPHGQIGIRNQFDLEFKSYQQQALTKDPIWRWEYEPYGEKAKCCAVIYFDNIVTLVCILIIYFVL